MSLFSELNRRNVVRVGVAYAVIGWVLAQIAEFAFENFGAPDWVLKSFVVVLLLGLPVALFLAWAFELTPEGVKHEKDVDRSKSITRTTARKIDFVIIGALVIAVGYFAWERQQGEDDTANNVSVAAPADTTPDDAGSAVVRSIAVLPFVNMSNDESQEWFSDGLTEEILNALARTPDLLVAARTSSFQYKGRNEDVQSIAAELGVAHILEGSVRRDSQRLRVTAQLIRASDGFHLWSQNYDRKPEDVIALQEEVAIEIATALETAMDPEALADMVSSGTRSVPAYNAYLEGLAHGVSTLSTGDGYEFIEAMEAFERAVELDPEFALAYWELAKFWEIQLRTTNVVAGMVELPKDEMRRRFNGALENAIRYAQDEVTRLQFRVFETYEEQQFAQALRLNTDYLEKRPNDRYAQEQQLSLLADLQKDDELQATIIEFHQRDGHDLIVLNNSMTYSLISNDAEFMRQFALEALERQTESPFIKYQAHRVLLWAGDIDGASNLLPLIMTSDMPEDSRTLASLRQACAEGRLEDAASIFNRIVTEFEDNTSIAYLSHRIMGQNDAAREILRPFEESGDVLVLADFLSYAHFDARDYPSLVRLLQSQGAEPREPRELPYQCRSRQA